MEQQRLVVSGQEMIELQVGLRQIDRDPIQVGAISSLRAIANTS